MWANIHFTEWAFGQLMHIKSYSLCVSFFSNFRKSISIFCLYGIFLFLRLSSFVRSNLFNLHLFWYVYLAIEIATMLQLLWVNEWASERVGRFFIAPKFNLR